MTVKSVVREICRMMEGRRESIENGRHLYSEAVFLEMVAFRMSTGFCIFLSNGQPVVSRVLCYLGGSLKPAVGASLQADS